VPRRTQGHVLAAEARTHAIIAARGSESPGGPAPKSSQGHALRSRAKPQSCPGRATTERAPHPAPHCRRQRRLTRTAAGRRSAPKPGARCLCPTPTHAFSINPALWRAAGSVDQTAPAPLTSPAYAWHPEGHRLPWPRTADDHEARDRRVGGGRLALGVAAAALLRAKVNPPGWLRSSATNCSRAAGGSRPEPGSHGKLSVAPAARLRPSPSFYAPMLQELNALRPRPCAGPEPGRRTPQGAWLCSVLHACWLRAEHAGHKQPACTVSVQSSCFNRAWSAPQCSPWAGE